MRAYGFFTELLSLEERPFRIKFTKIMNSLIRKYDTARADLLNFNCVDYARRYINLAKILIRFGQSDRVMKNFPIRYSGPYELEVKMLREVCSIEHALSTDKPIDVDSLIALSNTFINNHKTTIREKISLLNSIIVYFYRYQKAASNSQKPLECAHVLIELLDVLEGDSFINKLYSSIAYRGLAMVSEFSENQRTLLLERAEDIARNLTGSNEQEQAVAYENLYTCLQSISKWRQHLNDFASAETSLLEMITLDQYDSTGFSELGFLHQKMDKIVNARDNFARALELGPPATSMNAYYYAKCLEQTGQLEESIQYLYKSAELDEQAVSPWLDLLDYFSGRDSHNSETIKIANHIYGTAVLREQLEEHEIKHIQNIIN